MIPAPVSWFAIGAVFGAVLCGWPWHPRFSRYQPRRRRSVPARLRHCPTHGQQPENAWGCPDCVRELREELARQGNPGPLLPVLPASPRPRPKRRQPCR